MARMEEFRARGTTILFVSHALDSIRTICDQAIWIDHGRLLDYGPVARVTEAYRAFLAGNGNAVPG